MPEHYEQFGEAEFDPASGRYRVKRGNSKSEMPDSGHEVPDFSMSEFGKLPSREQLAEAGRAAAGDATEEMVDSLRADRGIPFTGGDQPGQRYEQYDDQGKKLEGAFPKAMEAMRRALEDPGQTREFRAQTPVSEQPKTECTDFSQQSETRDVRRHPSGAMNEAIKEMAAPGADELANAEATAAGERIQAEERLRQDRIRALRKSLGIEDGEG